jgi:hypothetical protein
MTETTPMLLYEVTDTFTTTPMLLYEVTDKKSIK